MLMILYQFRNDGIRDKKAGLRNAETSSDRNEVAGGEGGGESRSGAVGAEEVRIDSVTGTKAEHHALKDDLIISQALEAADGSKVAFGSCLDIRFQRRIVPEASAVKESMSTWTKTKILAMVPIGAVVAGAMARKGKIRDFIVLIPCRTKF